MEKQFSHTHNEKRMIFDAVMVAQKKNKKIKKSHWDCDPLSTAWALAGLRVGPCLRAKHGLYDNFLLLKGNRMRVTAGLSVPCLSCTQIMTPLRQPSSSHFLRRINTSASS